MAARWCEQLTNRITGNYDLHYGMDVTQKRSQLRNNAPNRGTTYRRRRAYIQTLAYGFVGTVFSLLCAHPGGYAAAVVAAVGIGLGGMGVAMYRYNALQAHSAQQKVPRYAWYSVAASVIAWAAVGVGVCLFGLFVNGDHTDWNQWTAARALVYGGLGMAFLGDVLYVSGVSPSGDAFAEHQ